MSLSIVLRGNAAFTSVCAAACLIDPQQIAQHTALPGSLWTIGLGAGLALFVPVLLIAASRLQLGLIKLVIALDWGYVAIAAIFLLFNWRQADVTGVALIVGSMSIVALCAVLQTHGLAALKAGAQQ